MGLECAIHLLWQNWTYGSSLIQSTGFRKNTSGICTRGTVNMYSTLNSDGDSPHQLIQHVQCTCTQEQDRQCLEN